MGKRVLVTGAAGFVGSHMVDYFMARGDDVVACDANRLNMHGDPLKRLRQHGDKLKWLRCDLSDSTSVDMNLMCSSWKPHIIINMASDSHVDRSIREPRDVWTNNTELMINMLEYAESCDELEAFVQFSTDEVYGPTSVELPEWSPIVPSNPYSASKAAQEALVISFWRTFGLPVVLMNGTNIIGERQHPEKFLPKIIRCFNDKVSVPIYGEAVPKGSGQQPKTGVRSYTDVLAVARAIEIVCRRPPLLPSNSEKPSRYHIAGPRQVSNLELMYMVADAMRIRRADVQYHIVPLCKARPGHDICYALDTQKLRELGWDHNCSVAASVERTVQWFLQNPEWLNDPVFEIAGPAEAC